MRPQYLKDIISLSAGEAGQRALRALTKLCNFLLSGQLPSEICHLLYGASLCALHKKDGGIRPIAIGNCLRRLTSKLTCFQSRNIVNSYLSPHQLRVATKLGCEAAIHTTRTFVNNDLNRSKVVLKLDFKNAFNSVERNCIPKEVQCHTPLLYPYLYLFPFCVYTKLVCVVNVPSNYRQVPQKGRSCYNLAVAVEKSTTGHLAEQFPERPK
jgi:hypothetical protein